MFAWLFNRAYKVYEWFGSSYPVWVSRVRNFFSYLRSYRDQAVKWVKDWAYPKILAYYYLAKAYVVTKYNSAVAWTNTAAANVRKYLLGRVQAVKDLINIRVPELWAGINNTVSKFIKADNVVIAAIKNWFWAKITNLLAPIIWIINFRQFIIDLKALFTEENKKRFIWLIQQGYSFLLDFLTRPLSTILAVIEPIFLEFLGFILAYALGSEKYHLPDWPDWFSGSGGGPVSGFDPPGDAKRNLGKPLNNLYISGYRFRVGHRGLDLGLKNGDPVFAMHSGKVEYVNQAFSGYGFQVTLSGGPWWTRSAHLQRLGVRKGDEISKGKVIGLGDDTGNSTGPHLHLEIKYNGKFVDPEIILF